MRKYVERVSGDNYRIYDENFNIIAEETHEYTNEVKDLKKIMSRDEFEKIGHMIYHSEEIGSDRFVGINSIFD